MTDTASVAVCPPHHWHVTTDLVAGEVYHRHRCSRCAAEKTVPGATTALKSWKSQSSPPSRKGRAAS